MAKLLANAKLYRNRNGEEPVNAGEELKSLLTGLFFSASWCAPCHQFTPQLRQFYERFNARSEKGFEVVFLSQDKTEAEMREYLEKHGDWLFLAHGDPLAKELKLKYGVQGIPALVLIREDGKIVSLEGAEEMQNCFCILDERKADSLVLNWQAQFGGNSQNKF